MDRADFGIGVRCEKSEQPMFALHRIGFRAPLPPEVRGEALVSTTEAFSCPWARPIGYWDNVGSSGPTIHQRAATGTRSERRRNRKANIMSPPFALLRKLPFLRCVISYIRFRGAINVRSITGSAPHEMAGRRNKVAISLTFVEPGLIKAVAGVAPLKAPVTSI
jgi:hypothetical protein